MDFIPLANMFEICLSICYAGFFLFIMGKMSIFKLDLIPLRNFQGLFLLKLFAGFCLYLIYTKYYPDRSTADIFRYFDDSEIIYKAAFDKPYDFFRMFTGYNSGQPDLLHYYDAMRNWYNTDLIFNDTRTMIRFSALMRFFSFGTYYPHAIVMSFLAMVGLTAIYRLFIAAQKGKEFILMFVVYLMPSTLLWTSGLIKEAFLLFSVGMMFFTLNQIIIEGKRNLMVFVNAFLFLACLFLIKPYIIFMVFPGAISWILFQKYKTHKLIQITGIYLIYGILICNFASEILGKNIPDLLTSKQQEFYFVAERDHANSLITIPKLEGTYSSLVLSAPSAIITSVFRPHILEVKNPLMLFAALENALILVLVIWVLIALPKVFKNKFPDLLYIALFFSFAIFVLTGLVTPILGAVVRYKVPALPFFLFTLVTLIPSKYMKYQPKWFLNLQ